LGLLKLFDKNGDGSLDFNEFLIGIRGQPNNKRQAMIDKAFLKFDKDGSGTINIYDLKGVYNCKMHP
jgi:Ca2+-binding EF-hand superfamily protein